MGRAEVKNTLFEIDSILPTRGTQNDYLYRTFKEYRANRGHNQSIADKALHKVLLWLDALVIRYVWAAKKWPKRYDFHNSYFRDWYRLRDFPQISMDKEDLLQDLRLEILDKLRRYRVKYKAPVGGYVSRALFYGLIKAERKQTKEQHLLEVIRE